MSGHSHWTGIKHKKEVVDQKRGQVFSKLLSAIAIAARVDSNPQFNPKLRAAIDKAKESKIPQEKIEGAIRRASEDKNLEELMIEAYGPEGVAIIISLISSNKSRTISEIKKVLLDSGAKLAEPGSVLWAFDLPVGGGGNWQPKFTQEISGETKEKLSVLINELKGFNDVQEVWVNAKL